MDAEVLDYVNGAVGLISNPELEFMWQYCLNANKILEVGAFLGKSTRLLACATTGIVVSVDPHSDVYTGWGLNNETSWNQFIINIEKHDNVIPLRMTSEEAALAQLEAAMEEGGIEAMLDVARQFGIPTNIEQ